MVELCEIPSPSYHEGPIAARIRQELGALGCEVTEDAAAATLGAGCGNILGRLPPTTSGIPVLLCAHLDTVPVARSIEVELRDDGTLANRHEEILGGDDKAAIAAMLVAVREVRRERIPHAGIELLFTPCEEVGLLGAACFDVGVLAAELGFVYDHSGPIGQIVTSAPWHKRITATFVGTAAHAGMQPEAGHSAITAAADAVVRMPLGRIDPETTANVGVIAGGDATNVVAPRCEIVAEARGHNRVRLGEQVTAMVDALTGAAVDGGCDLECRVDTQYAGYRLRASDPQVVLAERAFARLGVTPVHVPGGGGSDVNMLLRSGFPAVNLCNAMTEVHSPSESIAVTDLLAMVDVTRAILAEAVAR
jgi:tripeptide aminopeptidase